MLRCNTLTTVCVAAIDQRVTVAGGRACAPITETKSLGRSRMVSSRGNVVESIWRNGSAANDLPQGGPGGASHGTRDCGGAGRPGAAGQAWRRGAVHVRCAAPGRASGVPVTGRRRQRSAVADAPQDLGNRQARSHAHAVARFECTPKEHFASI